VLPFYREHDTGGDHPRGFVRRRFRNRTPGPPPFSEMN
jgi:hypothetical protein